MVYLDVTNYIIVLLYKDMEIDIPQYDTNSEERFIFQILPKYSYMQRVKV